MSRVSFPRAALLKVRRTRAYRRDPCVHFVLTGEGMVMYLCTKAWVAHRQVKPTYDEVTCLTCLTATTTP
jgi:hypothetical protein